eukprot:gene1794-2534_t
MSNKSFRDNPKLKPVNGWYRLLGWLFVMSQNAMMLLYVMLFALEESQVTQRAWIYSLYLWIGFDIVFVSTGTVILTHVIVPRLVMNDVEKNKLKLVSLIQKFHEKVAESNEKIDDTTEAISFDQSIKKENKCDNDSQTINIEPFNAAKYFFVSYRIAEKYPDLAVSPMLRQFVTQLPKHHQEFS